MTLGLVKLVTKPVEQVGVILTKENADEIKTYAISRGYEEKLFHAYYGLEGYRPSGTYDGIRSMPRFRGLRFGMWLFFHDWGDRDTVLEDEYGYFTTLSATEDKIEAIHRKEYDNYLKFFERYHSPSPFVGKRWEDRIAQYEQDLKEWQVLWDAGIEKEEPVKPRRAIAKSYEDWFMDNDDLVITELVLSEDN